MRFRINLILYLFINFKIFFEEKKSNVLSPLNKKIESDNLYFIQNKPKMYE